MYMYVSREMIEDAMKATLSKEYKKECSMGKWEELVDQVERFLDKRDLWLESLTQTAVDMYEEGDILEERVKKVRNKKGEKVIAAEIID